MKSRIKVQMKTLSFITFYTKLLKGAKPLRIRFDKVDRYLRIFDGTRYLQLFGPERYNAIYDRSRYLISEKSDITHSINHNFARVRIHSYNSLPIEKTLTFLYVTILNKPVFNQNKNHHYYNIFLGKGLYEDKSNATFF